MVITNNGPGKERVFCLPLSGSLPEGGPSERSYDLGMFPRHLLAFGKVEISIFSSGPPEATLETYGSANVPAEGPTLIKVGGKVVEFTHGYANVLEEVPPKPFPYMAGAWESPRRHQI